MPLAQQVILPLPRPTEGLRREAHFCPAGMSRSRRDWHAQCRSRATTSLHSFSQRRACCGRPMCAPLSDRSSTFTGPAAMSPAPGVDLVPPTPGPQVALTRRSRSHSARPHVRTCALHEACLSSDPANSDSAAACSDCASCPRIMMIRVPVIFAQPPVTGCPPRARRAKRTGRQQLPATAASRRRAGWSVPIQERT